MQRGRERYIYIWAFIISILFHLMLLFLFALLKIFSFTVPAYARNSEPAPIVLEFEQPPAPKEFPAREETPSEPQPLPDPARLFEVVENPNADEQTPDETAFLSTQASRSAAPQVTSPDNSPLPKDAPQQPMSKFAAGQEQSQAQPDQPVQDPQLEGTATIFAANQPEFSREALTGEKKHPGQAGPERSQEGENAAPLSQEEFDADMIGEVRMSTYAWEWAPWWLAFERKLRHYWYVPTAWQLGLIDGYTYVKIRVSREGELMKYEVLKHVGHPSLQESSINALEGVFPFKALPPDFPDEYLELQFVMIYPNVRELLKQRQR
ncbi:MAG: hypothetical protein D6681_16160 [Calditrichaeota bacterium]|nr:MAG: hypothetical protein D6681_16160 [Calditrichota bacterium]